MKKVIVGAALSFGLITGCGSSVAESEPRPKPLIEGTYHVDDGEWNIICWGPPISVEAKRGDILLKLLLNNTAVRESADLSDPNIPPQVLTSAAADLNQLENPDKIFAYQTYIVPTSCQLNDPK